MSISPPPEPPSAEQIAAELRGILLPDITLSPEDEILLQNALSFDPAQLAFDVPRKPLPSRSINQFKSLDVARTDRPDGGAIVALKQPLPTEWDSKVGVDLALASDPRSGNPVTNPMRTIKDDSGSGAAWASVGVAPFATVDARVDAANDSGLLATKFKHAMPVGNNFSVTHRKPLFGDRNLRHAASGDPGCALDGRAGRARPARRFRIFSATTTSPNSPFCRAAPRWPPVCRRPATIRSRIIR